MKLICFYLPQFHETEENNRWWGQGYTDWTALKDSKKYFKTHRRPRIPLDHNYYDLSLEDGATIRWQAELAKQHGIYGFCIYHYWFGGKQLLYKPVDVLRAHKEIDIHYTLCWDSNTWKRTWYADQHAQEVLMEQQYGDEKIWTKHFMDLLPDFMDERYIKIDNKPVFHIYRAYQIPCLLEMRQCWDKLAMENGFAGIYLIAGDVENRNEERLVDAIDAFYNYEPVHAFHNSIKRWYGIITISRTGIIKRLNRIFHCDFFPDKRSAKGIYREIIKLQEEEKKKTYKGIFVDYDDTPRRQKTGAVYTGNNVHLFKRCLEKQIEQSNQDGRQDDFLYINAWNEWGESAYLEPDEENKYLYLDTIKDVLSHVKDTK